MNSPVHVAPASSSSVTPCRVSASDLLRIFGGAYWRARLDPFEIIEWQGSVAEHGATAPDLLQAKPHAFEELIYPLDLPVFQRALRDFLQGKARESCVDYRLIVDGGELLWVRQWFIADQEDASEFVQGLMRVVSEEKRLQWEIMRTSESERMRLGQEVHDDVCQVLTGINYLLHLLHRKFAERNLPEAAELAQINHEIQAGLDRTRALAHGLLPAKSDFNNLSQALRDLARQVATRFKIELVSHLPSELPVLSRERLLHLYRIVQEAASNAFKHAGATRLDVSLIVRDRHHVLSIEDNGPGWPPADQRAEGVGLSVMRNRAELIGGWLELSNGSRGACVQVHLPQ